MIVYSSNFYLHVTQILYINVFFMSSLLSNVNMNRGLVLIFTISLSLFFFCFAYDGDALESLVLQVLFNFFRSRVSSDFVA